MPAPLLLDLSHTSHTRARTGIQRVARSLHTALGDRALAITHDPHRAVWRSLDAREHATLAAGAPAKKRSAQWPLAVRMRGRISRVLHPFQTRRTQVTVPADSSGLIVPEIFSAEVGRNLPALFEAVRGPRVALFHDAIALKFPELTPTKTVARFPAYLVELLAFDGIAAVSEESRATLIDYWRWLGVSRTPSVAAIPLGINTRPLSSIGENSPPPGPPTILGVGSIEGRKNHIALLDACELLWARGEKFSLHLVGLANAQTGVAALAKLHALQAAGRPLRYDGAVSDAAVDAAYAACTFTVYPSVIEGFGLPVIESLAHGKPCICSAHGALGESARGGGCVMLATVDAPSIADAIRRLLHTRDALPDLAKQARARQFKTWSDYARELSEWICALPRRTSA